jgi:geranylgeranyl diphosphate synthase, type I
MTPTSARATAAITEVAGPVNAALETFLAERRADAAALAAEATEPIDEILRIIRAGGKRIRPAFCFWGFRAGGGEAGEPIWRAAAALELLHTMALIHDDVIDAGRDRRGVASVHRHAAARATARGLADASRLGMSVAIVTGDLAAAFADELFAATGFPADRQAVAGARLHRMRAMLGVGAYLDLVGTDVALEDAAYLKGGAYTVEGPLLIGAALAGSSPELDEVLRSYGRPLGEAFQLLDDLADGDAAPGATRQDALALVERAADAVASPPLTSAAARALAELAEVVGSL